MEEGQVLLAASLLQAMDRCRVKEGYNCVHYRVNIYLGQVIVIFH